jgi:DNA topoisomerase I
MHQMHRMPEIMIAGANAQKHWKTLRHAGVLFPPEYVPHKVKMLYDGQPVKLTREQEEIATMYAAMLESDFIKKAVFRKNFWAGWKNVLGKDHVIQSLEKCNFTPIFDHLQGERAAKKTIDKDEKKATKAAKDASEAIYKVAYVNGKAEPVGNFRVEPPGLFRGRGAHPKMGMLKKRIMPNEITINIGQNEAIPKHPYSDMKINKTNKTMTWKEVVHDPTVTWLAKWNDTINTKDVKYVFLAATSTVKSNSDQKKYETARLLAKKITKVRKNYEKDFSSTNNKKQQIATAIYLIDRLALRAGHEKGEDEADTVGTCTLKVENVKLDKNTNHFITLDFLGKDSIRYTNTVQVDPRVYKNIEKFIQNKAPTDMLFDTFDATALNKELKAILPGLSAKVFRTYNASTKLDAALWDPKSNEIENKDVTFKKAVYDRANKDVAVLCNHQRCVSKTHGAQIGRIDEKIKELKDMKKKKQDAGSDLSDKQKEQLKKLKTQKKLKDELKEVALGTSKINYLDPRISVAWAVRNDVPIEKIFNKTLLDKFKWSLDVDMNYKF